MATLGNTATPGSGFWFDDTGNKEFYTSSLFQMVSPGGYLTDMYAYFGGDGASVPAKLVIWKGDKSGTFWVSNQFTAPSGSRAIGGQGWQHIGGLNVWIPAGHFYFGFWAGGNVVWTFEGSGGVQGEGASSPGAISGSSDEYGGAGYGALGAYMVYTPLATPNITSITPAVAPPGTTITITGTSFAQASSVTIGGTAVSFTIVSDTSITATVPSGVGGSVAVIVTNPAGNASYTITAGQIYVGASIAAIKAVYANPGGTGIVPIKAIWVSNGSGGVKRIW